MKATVQLKWLIQFWAQPASVFKQVIDTKGSWVLPLLVIFFAMIGSRIFYYQTEELVNLYADVQGVDLLTAADEIEELTPEELKVTTDSLRGIWVLVFMMLTPALFCVSYLFFMAERFFSKTRHRLGQWFAVTLWSWLPLAIGALVYALHFALAGEPKGSEGLDIFKFANHFPAINQNATAYSWLGRFSMMHVFAMMYQLLAFKVLTEKNWNVSIFALMMSTPAILAFVFFIEYV